MINIKCKTINKPCQIQMARKSLIGKPSILIGRQRCCNVDESELIKKLLGNQKEKI